MNHRLPAYAVGAWGQRHLLPGRGPLRIGATEEEKVRAATQYLSALQQCAVWLLTDGSLRTGINNEGSSAVIIWGWGGGGAEDTGRATLLQLSSSDAGPGVRAGGPAQQPPRMGRSHRDLHRQHDLPGYPPGGAYRADIATGRRYLACALVLSQDHRPIQAQWVPAHCGIAGNEQTGATVKKTAELPRATSPWTPEPSAVQWPEPPEGQPSTAGQPADSGP